MGRYKQRSVFEHAQNANIQIILRAHKVFIRAFALRSYNIYYIMILFAGGEGPDQTARMRRLIWASAVRIFSLDTTHMFSLVWNDMLCTLLKRLNIYRKFLISVYSNI